jgi:hypothetical protein
MSVKNFNDTIGNLTAQCLNQLRYHVPFALEAEENTEKQYS